MNITERTIYNPTLILKAYAFKRNWYRNLGLTNNEQAPQVMLFIIEEKRIKALRLIPRTLISNYKPSSNEYYLDRIRDSEDIITDYNLAPAQKLVNLFNEIF